ncbi:C-terminal binding protein, partial [Mariniphaga sp.]|uniref:C-terminal binding protein n=1 Tax=Mariniphaga sp. TaxID=1954475 RepID=UPI0035687203
SLFEGSGFNLKIHSLYKGEKAEKMEFAREAHGILVRHTTVDSEFLSGMKNLKAIVRYGVGYDNIDVDACTRYGVKVANVQGYANHSVSDHALALLLTCSRGMWNPKKQIIAQFAAPPVEDVFELHDKTLGIIGLGRIGSEFSKKAAPLFREIIASDPYKPQHYFDSLNVRKTSMDDLLQQSDMISIHCNLTEETTHLLNRETFGKMKKKPVIINTARGEVMDEKALLEALNAGQIHSAGLDVYENEPATEAQKPLINHPRTISTGHYAWYSDRAAHELQKRAALNLFNLLTGKKTEDCLNPEIQ